MFGRRGIRVVVEVAMVVMVTFICCPATLAQAADKNATDPNHEADICAMTDVMVAMKDLIFKLSEEIRDLRLQVKTNCQAGATATDGANKTTTTTPTDSKKGPQMNATEDEATDANLGAPDVTTDDPTDYEEYDLDLGFGVDSILEEEKEGKEEDFNYEDVENNPVSEVITGLANWWDTFNPFEAQPSTTPRPDMEYIQEDYNEGEEDYQVDGAEESVGDGGTDDLYPPPPPPQRPRPQPTRRPSRPRPSRPRPRPTTTTTTTTTPLPYTLPPPPTQCPSPFQLLAEGCYLVIDDSREWRSWGEAFAFCQSYRGQLAAPWRLPQLQQYLSQYYSDAFWVGANKESRGGQWKWLSGRMVQQSEWKMGQPDRNPSKKCVFLDKWSGYRANTFYCGEKYPFVCEST